MNLDLLYLQNCCMWNDLKILFRTIRVVLTGSGSCVQRHRKMATSGRPASLYIFPRMGNTLAKRATARRTGGLTSPAQNTVCSPIYGGHCT